MDKHTETRRTWRELWLRPRMGRRVAALLLGTALIGGSIGVFRIVGFGTPPGSTLSLGFSHATGVSFGTCQLLINVMLGLFMVRFDPSKLGVGTLVNMVCVGYTADFCVYLLTPFLPEAGLSMARRLVLLAGSVAVFLVAAAFYIVADLGVGPYDGVPLILGNRAKRLTPRTVRVIWDVSALTVGFLLGATLGLTTVLTGFFLGPVIAAISDRAGKWFQ